MSYQHEVDELRALPEHARQAMVDALIASTPSGAWPYGMPSSLAPRLVIIGISPGGSPASIGEEYNYGPGVDHGGRSGFYYPDGRRYWEKIRYLARAYFNRDGDYLSEGDAIALTSHLNLGTGSTGRATDATIEPAYVRWAARLLNSTWRPELVVFLGYVGYSGDAAFRAAWNSPGGLAVDWTHPETEIPFERWRFREWQVTNSLEQEVRVVIWPQHPSRVPFSSQTEWQRSVDDFLQRLPSAQAR